jgi:serine phosphatase RsbU (regulator of sigma subunit)
MLTADLVGGDYFDIINTEGREWFLIGDVSGHGVTAGLIMMMTQTAIHTILNSMETKDPSILLSKINQVITSNIHKMKLNKYMTLTLFLKDTDGMIYYSGMHQDLLLYQANKKSVKVIETNGSWIGYYDLHDEFQVDNFYMESGDVLLLFTDGVTESINAKKEMFEINGLIRILETSGNLSALEIKNKILGSLTDFKTEDDITFMVCKRN